VAAAKRSDGFLMQRVHLCKSLAKREVGLAEGHRVGVDHDRGVLDRVSRPNVILSGLAKTNHGEHLSQLVLSSQLNEVLDPEPRQTLYKWFYLQPVEMSMLIRVMLCLKPVAASSAIRFAAADAQLDERGQDVPQMKVWATVRGRVFS